jgi:hypothetical protein
MIAGAGSALAQSNNAGVPEALQGPLVTAPNCYGNYGDALADVTSSSIICSKNFANITHPATGIYCFTLSPSVAGTGKKTAQVSVEWAYSLGVVLFAQYNRINTVCAAGKLEVQTYKGDTAGVGSSYQTPVLSDSVAFMIFVP